MDGKVPDGPISSTSNVCFSIVIIDLHPCFMKPAGRRVMEIYENEAGDQVKETSMRVKRYLNIPPVLSKAVQTQDDHIVSDP
jgi:hypothetical protein